MRLPRFLRKAHGRSTGSVRTPARGRHQVINAVLADVERHGTIELDAQRRGEVEAEFGDFGTFLLAAQRRWFMMLEARLDSAIEEGRAVDLECFTDLCRSVSENDSTLHEYLDAVGRSGPLRRALDEHRWRVHHLFGFDPGTGVFPGGGSPQHSNGLAAAHRMAERTARS